MRTAHHSLQPSEGERFAVAKNHFGLTYDAFSPPLTHDGKVDEEQREAWLKRCEETAVSPEYKHFFERWKASFDPRRSKLQEIALTARLLVGHGNPSGSDVGLSVHRVWGVPIIPGSALKGLLANYVDAVLGAADGEAPSERDHWRGVIRTDRRVTGAPGKYFAALFGAPAVDAVEDFERKAEVEFHDALYVPSPEQAGDVAKLPVRRIEQVVDPKDRPFAADVLTVHQKSYYNDSGAQLPNDWNSPNPVSFITVKPGVKMLVALSGPQDWTALAMNLLGEALQSWGVGGKTAAGYGRAVLP